LDLIPRVCPVGAQVRMDWKTPLSGYKTAEVISQLSLVSVGQEPSVLRLSAKCELRRSYRIFAWRRPVIRFGADRRFSTISQRFPGVIDFSRYATQHCLLELCTVRRPRTAPLVSGTPRPLPLFMAPGATAAIATPVGKFQSCFVRPVALLSQQVAAGIKVS